MPCVQPVRHITFWWKPRQSHDLDSRGYRQQRPGDSASVLLAGFVIVRQDHDSFTSKGAAVLFSPFPRPLGVCRSRESKRPEPVSVLLAFDHKDRIGHRQLRETEEYPPCTIQIPEPSSIH